MKLTAEQLMKARSAKSAEELMELAKAEGVEATEEQIRAQFDAMHKEGELADDELNNVSGAGCGPTIKTVKCPNCGKEHKVPSGTKTCFTCECGKPLDV